MIYKQKRLFSLISLGCPKNLVDSERFYTIFNKYEYIYTDDHKKAEMILINTCGFIQDAQQEAVMTILEVANYKSHRLKKLIVTGCLVKRFRAELIADIPEVDHWIDLQDFHELECIISSGDVSREVPQRTLLTPMHYAYLRVSDGCDNRCSYCTIPDIRGRHRSEKIETLLAECEFLAKSGVKELIVNAQDTTMYGVDTYGKPSLIELLRRIDSLKLFPWIRLLYLHPAHFSEVMIDEMASIDSLLPYFDIPLQHINSEILSSMNRKIDRAGTIEVLNHIRKTFPECATRTTFITGYPGEKRKHFTELESFIKEFRFTRLGVFCYSAEPGTPAYQLQGRVSAPTAQRRADILMATQQEISQDILSSFVGRQLQVIIERKSDIAQRSKKVSEGKVAVYEARSYLDAPDIDGVVYVYGGEHRAGDIVEVSITDSQIYDLIGEYKK